MTGADPEEEAPAPSGRVAVAISQAYVYVVAALGLLVLLGGAIAALIALRKWILPISEAADAPGLFGPPIDRNDAARSFLGALAFAIPGALVFAWHLREARRRERRASARAAWGGVLYFHLVALISLLIGLGGLVAGLHALRDSVLPFCYDLPGLDRPAFEGPTIEEVPEIELPEDFDPEVLRSEECYPSRPEAIRSALDGGIVASVGGAAWLWHLRRGRRALEPPLEG